MCQSDFRDVEVSNACNMGFDDDRTDASMINVASYSRRLAQTKTYLFQIPNIHMTMLVNVMAALLDDTAGVLLAQQETR